MARKSEWIVRLPAGIEALKRLTSGSSGRPAVVVDAKTLAGILKLNLRVAQKLLARFASPEFGGMAERRALIAGLEAIAKGESEEAEAEVQRRAKLREVLDDAAHDLFLHAAKIEPPPGYVERVRKKKLRATTVEDLPDTIQIARHRVTITCTDAYDLFRQVREMTYAAANDLDRLAEAIEGPALPPDTSAEEFRFVPGAEPVWRVTMEAQ